MTDQLVHVRAFPATLERSGPRTLSGPFIPWNVVADVLDELPDGEVDIYQEGFRRGAFDSQVTTTEPGVLRRIGLVHTHSGGLGYLGPVIALRDEPDALHGDVAILRSKATDVEDLLESGVKELSIEFRLARLNSTEVDGAGVRWRTRAHLDQIALEPRGAYTGARVLAFRAELDELAQAEAAQRAAAEAVAQAEREEAEAAERAVRQRAELDEWLAAEEVRQAELRARYLTS